MRVVPAPPRRPRAASHIASPGLCRGARAVKRGTPNGLDRTQRTANEKKTLMTLLAKLDAIDDQITDLEQRDVQAVSA